MSDDKQNEQKQQLAERLVTREKNMHVNSHVSKIYEVHFYMLYLKST